jgi:hypothetical protein
MGKTDDNVVPLKRPEPTLKMAMGASDTRCRMVPTIMSRA